MTHTRYYNLYLVDGTKPAIGFTPAPTQTFEFAEESPEPERPPLEHVLRWIDTQAPAILEAATAMRQNPGTTTLYLEARLPIEPGHVDTPKHRNIGKDEKIDFVSNVSIGELKKRVTAIYKSADIRRPARIQPVSGSARTRTSEERANDERAADERHLRSGNATLGDLMQSPLIGSMLKDADDRAFRLGAAMSISSNEALISAGVFVGYLLTAAETGAQNALATAIWLQYLISKRIKENKTPDFWNALNLGDRRNEIEKIASDSDATSSVNISSKLAAILLRSIQFAREAGSDQTFSTRDLLTCLIGRSGQQMDDSALRMLGVLKVDVRKVCRMYRDWLATHRGIDRPEIVDRELGITAEAARGSWDAEREAWKANVLMDEKGDGILTEDGHQIATEETPTSGKDMKDKGVPASIVGWRDGVAGIATGAVQFDDERDVEDALKIQDYATRFARVIALRATEMPLSVALFGEWGSGKTYFMKLLRQEIRKLTEKNEEANWCPSVVPIRFNAWHYVDANLWASFVTEIFDQLFDYLAGHDQGATNRLKAAEKLMKQIEGGKGAIAEINEGIRVLEIEKKQLEDEISEIERRLQTAQRNVKHHITVAEQKLDNLQSLVPQVLSNSEWKEALKALGLEEAATSYKEFSTRIEELHSLTGRIRALGSTMVSGRWGVVSLLFLLALLWLAPVVMGRLTSWFTNPDGALRSVVMAIGSASGLLMGISGWLGTQAAHARKVLTIAENVKHAALKARVEKESPSCDDCEKKPNISQGRRKRPPKN